MTYLRCLIYFYFSYKKNHRSIHGKSNPIKYYNIFKRPQRSHRSKLD